MIAIAGAFAVAPTTASADEVESSPFSCRAIPLQSGPTDHVPANPDLDPCDKDYNSSLSVPLGALGGVQLLAGDTQDYDDNPVGTAVALATTAGVNLNVGGLSISLAGVQSLATAGCVAGQPVVTSSSRVVGLTINGKTLQITRYTKINIGLVVIELNKTIATPTSKTQQAVVIRTILPNSTIIIGEATAGYSGQPCLT